MIIMSINRTLNCLSVFKRLLFIIAVLIWISCNMDDNIHQRTVGAEFMASWQNGLMQTVSEDLFSPPVASRIYAYVHLTGYEALQSYQTELPSFLPLLGDPLFTKQDPMEGMPLAAYLEASSEMAKHLVYRDHMIQSLKEKLIDEYELDTLHGDYVKGKIFGQTIAEVARTRADMDGYNQTRNFPKYTSGDQPFSWQSTAPTFGEALEPHWFRLMPWFVDSSTQFRSDMPIPFDKEPGSTFYKEAEKVLGYVSRADEDSVAVAVYWDCNPGPTMLDGHFMQVRKQNTPGGHWLGIVTQICTMKSLSLLQSAYVAALVSMGIADGFICAWDTKYAHDLLRPETYINTYIDSDWRPKLESPLFPEYSSAHSIISAIAATLLTETLGDTVSFIDSTNISFGIPSRHFDSFWDAANEAAMSRLLGGIHYPFACSDGIEQGKAIGQFILAKAVPEVF